MSYEVLFVCTGNYYRSRFAELLFNACASRDGLNWKADSRGLAAASGKHIRPVSPLVLERLQGHGFLSEEEPRGPTQLEEADLAKADLTIALDAVEHLPLIESRFPKWTDQILYWHIPDLNLMGADDALASIENNVMTLIQQFAATKSTYAARR